jgi:magnesium transporter
MKTKIAARVIFVRIHKQSKKAGLAPGTLVHIGEKKSDITKVTMYEYHENFFLENTVVQADALRNLPVNREGVLWVNVDGFARVDILEAIGTRFGLHPLTMEDILNAGQRPKAENFDHYHYIVFKMLSYNDLRNTVDIEQVSLVVGPDYVLSFQEREGDVFGSLRERLRLGKGWIRKLGADYLAYSLLDAVVDSYFDVLEKIGERIETIEDRLVADPANETLWEVHNLKREMIYLRRSVWPLREVVNRLIKSDDAFLDKTTSVYLRDVYDHIAQILDTTEIYREMLSGMLDIYLSSVSNRMNEVMKVLTIIATLFIPLTFVAGLYGMNFRFMPELDWPFGYPLVLSLMLIVAVSMIYYFKQKKWL